MHINNFREILKGGKEKGRYKTRSHYYSIPLFTFFFKVHTHIYVCWVLHRLSGQVYQTLVTMTVSGKGPQMTRGPELEEDLFFTV